jgi:hypothetical protein
MSAHSFPAYFDDNPRVDNVTFAVVPFDNFSGRVVASGVKAEVDGLFDRPIRNLSGRLVFINLPQQAAYAVTIDASDAGYFSPVNAAFPPANDPGSTAARLLMVPLIRRPDFPYAEATTLIRGVVERGSGKGATPVSGASIWAEPILDPVLDPIFNPILPPRFKTTSDERGAFALPLTRHRKHGDPPAQPVELHLKQGNDARKLTVEVSDGKSHSFEEPIDLTGLNEPKFYSSFQP